MAKTKHQEGTKKHVKTEVKPSSESESSVEEGAIHFADTFEGDESYESF